MVYELLSFPRARRVLVCKGVWMVYELLELPEGQACSCVRASGWSTSSASFPRARLGWSTSSASFPRARLVHTQGRLDVLRASGASRGPGLFVCKGVWTVYTGASRGPGLFVCKGVWMVYKLRELGEGQGCLCARASGWSTSLPAKDSRDKLCHLSCT